jgi:hypothetical protein
MTRYAASIALHALVEEAKAVGQTSLDGRTYQLALLLPQLVSECQ